MDWQFNIYSGMLFVTALVAAAMAVTVWQRRAKPGAVPLAVLSLGLTIWSVGQGLEVAVADVPGKIFWSQIQYIGIVIVPAAWLMLALQYTDLDTQWFPGRRIWLLAVMPLLTLLLVSTNGYHHLHWIDVQVVPRNDLWMWTSDYGIAFWVHTAYSYSLLLIGLWLLIRAAIRAPWPYRTQATILAIGAVIPWVSNVLSIFEIIVLPVNPTAFAFTLAGLVLFWGLFHHRLLDLAPVARHVMVDSIGDAMVALDEEDRVVDINWAAASFLDVTRTDALGESLGDLIPQQRPLLRQYQGMQTAHDELRLVRVGVEYWFDLQIWPLQDTQGHVYGRLIVWRDITERKTMEAELKDQAYRIYQLLDVARATSQSPSLEETMSNTLSIARSVTKADAGGLILVDEEQKVTHSLLTRGSVSPDVREVLLSRVMEAGLIGWVIRREELVLVDDAVNDPRWVTLPDQPYQVGSALGIPLHFGEKLLGGLILIHSEPRHFTEADATVLEISARQMALALGNALIYEDQRRIAWQQATLFKVLRALQSPMLLSEALHRAMEIIAAQTEWPVVALLTPNEDGNLYVNAAAGRLAEEALALTFSACELHAEGQEQPTFPDARCMMDAIPDELLPSVLLIPLEGPEGRLMLIASDTPLAFDEDARLLANSLGNVVRLVLRNAQLYETVNTERQRLAALVQSSRDGIVMIGNDNHILVVSQTALHYLGLTGQPENWIYRPITAALRVLRTYAPDAARTTLAEVQRIRRGDNAVNDGEHTILNRVVHWYNLPVLDGDRALGRLLLLQDVTEARQLAQMRDDLTHTMVHDLRNPLTGIHSSLALLKRYAMSALAADQRELLDIARRSTQQMLNMVNAILDISRLESGRMPLERDAFRLHALVDEVLDLQRTVANQKEITLIAEVPESLAWIDADPGLIGRVLQNLVGNALKFTPKGGSVRVKAVTQREASRIKVSVRDTGPGIPPDILPQLFQKFVTGQQEGHGSGLGLAFCKMVIEAHDEQLWVESPPGQGATFTFTLAMAEESAK